MLNSALKLRSNARRDRLPAGEPVQTHQRQSSATSDDAKVNSANVLGRHAPAGQRLEPGLVDAKSAYRPDIDGLRAAAVISVVIYHLFPGVLGAGYLGVDVFFVISGYLITGTMLRDWEKREFSLRKFYERRIRRIIPALLAMLIVVSSVAPLLLLPKDLVSYAKSVLATFAFASNLYFWQDTNYFSAGALSNPLLHTWSLGIEEQFYILFPVLVLLVIRLAGRRALFLTIASITILSFALAGLALQRNLGIAAFYLLPTRAWELGLGAILTFIPKSAVLGPVASAAAAGSGLALVAGSFLAVSGIFVASLPVATAACLGSALIVWAGQRTNIASRLLGIGPLAGVGLISYSIYLWHWPLYVFASYYTIQQPTAFQSSLVFAGSVVLSVLSWRYVEVPFRRRSMPARIVLLWWAFATVLLCGSAVAAIAARGFPTRFAPQAERFNDVAGNIYKCPIQAYARIGGALACRINATSSADDSPAVAVFGDSHALMYVPAVQQVLRARGLSGALFNSNGCLPTAELNVSRECAETQRRNLNAILNSRTVVVVVAFSWHNLVNDLSTAEGQPIGTVPWPLMRDHLSRLVASLRRAGKQVVLVGPIPYPGYDIPRTVSREIAFRGEVQSPLGETRAAYMKEFGLQQAWIASSPEGAIPLLPSAHFCDETRCSYELGGTSAYADSNHLAASTVLTIAPDFDRALAVALQRASAGEKNSSPKAIAS